MNLVNTTIEMIVKKTLFFLIFTFTWATLHAEEGANVTPSKADYDWATQFSGVSGKGLPVKGDGKGGWVSGSSGVSYQGNHPQACYKLSFEGKAKGTAIEKGLLPPILPAMELHLRDGVVTLGGDGNYYLTGSSGDNIWAFTKGVELWKSADLKHWTYLGLVWDIDRDAEDWVKTWRQHPRRAVRAVWAPEIHYLKGNYFICFSMCPFGIGILKSSTGKPEGPYVNAFATPGSIVNGIDPTLFEDTDGKVYFTYGAAKQIAQLKDDLSGFLTPFRDVVFNQPDHDKTHHAAKCEKRGMNDLGHEGAVLFKRNGKYYLGAADDYEGRYSSCVAVSDSLYGPYKMRHETIACAGGTGFFKDKNGDWWTSYFGNDTQSHFREKIGFVRISFSPKGLIYPALKQPFVPVRYKKSWENTWKNGWGNKYDQLEQLE
ncbi:MAG: family 43 glycosylhydrolase [Paludibacter sp.]